MSIIIDEKKCIVCGKCEKICQNSIFKTIDKKMTIVPLLAEKCLHCGRCIAICDNYAITLDGIDPTTVKKVEDIDYTENMLDNLFKTRRSIRNYSKKVPSKEILETALDYARYAPTARNSQLVEYVGVIGFDKMKQISDEMATKFINAPAPYANLVKTYNKGIDVFLRDAPALIVAHAPAEHHYSCQDASAAISYLELALHTLGLGSCWAGFLISCLNNTGLDCLPIPKGNKAYAALMLGYPSLQIKGIPPRKELRIKYL